MSGATVSFALFWTLVAAGAALLVVGRLVRRATRRGIPSLPPRRPPVAS